MALSAPPVEPPGINRQPEYRTRQQQDHEKRGESGESGHVHLQKFPLAFGPATSVPDFHEQWHETTQSQEISYGTTQFPPLSGTQTPPP